MHAEPSMVQIEKDGRTTRIRLPGRDLKPLRWVGYLLLAMAAIQTAFVCFWLVIPFAKAVDGGNGVGVFEAVVLLFGLVCCIPIGIQFYVSDLLLHGDVYSQIDMDDDVVQVTEHLGWYKRKRECFCSEIEMLEIVKGLTGDSEQANSSEQRKLIPVLREFGYALNAKLKSTAAKPSFLLLVAYPRETLDEVGQLLNSQFGLRPTVVGAEGALASEAEAYRIPIRESNEKIEVPQQIQRPSNCKVVVGEHDGMTTFDIPSGGLIRGSHGLFVMALLWNGFMGVFTYLVLSDGPLDRSQLVFIVFVSLFWLVGIAMLVGSIVLASRKTIVGVSDQQFFVQKKSLLGEKWKEAMLADIESISVGPSGVTVNDVPVNELRVFHQGDQKICFGSTMRDDSLRWLAGELHHQWRLRCPAT